MEFPLKNFFIIVRQETPSLTKNSYEKFEVKVETDDKLISKSKRIMKREKAKQRVKVKQECESPMLSGVYSKYIPEGFDNPDLDEKTRKKMIQMIRNRISAQSSRDKKKAYMMHLEEVKNLLIEEKERTVQEKEQLMKQLHKLEKAQKKLKSENVELMKNSNKTCGNCGEDKFDQDSKSVGESFSNLLSRLTGLDLNKIPDGNSKVFKRTMTLATMISIMMVMNIVQQGNGLIQG